MNELRILFDRTDDALTYRLAPSWRDHAGEAQSFAPSSMRRTSRTSAGISRTTWTCPSEAPGSALSVSSAP
jgi:hypothetical protein